MRAFFINGAKTNFADIIIENSTEKRICCVASYGFGVKQVERLIFEFEEVLLIADTSHSKLNKSAYESIVKMNIDIKNFTFKPMRNHAKMALIDNKTVIFTSANLSANRRTESYIIGPFQEVAGIDELKTRMICGLGDIIDDSFLDNNSSVNNLF